MGGGERAAAVALAWGARGSLCSEELLADDDSDERAHRPREHHFEIRGGEIRGRHRRLGARGRVAGAGAGGAAAFAGDTRAARAARARAPCRRRQYARAHVRVGAAAVGVFVGSGVRMGHLPSAFFPVASMAAMSAEALAVPLIVASFDARSTVALLTPSTASSAALTPPTQPPQVMPSTLRATMVSPLGQEVGSHPHLPMSHPQSPSVHLHSGPHLHVGMALERDRRGQLCRASRRLERPRVISVIRQRASRAISHNLSPCAYVTLVPQPRGRLRTVARRASRGRVSVTKVGAYSTQ